jgi:hypothetical protein
MTALRIYLADLTHVGNGISTESFPLNVGLIASYAKKIYRHEVDIRLFKYPGDLREAILDQPPHVLGCSHYAWNSNLSYYFCQWVKSIDRNILTVFGGTNYPFQPAHQEVLLKRRPDLDLHVFYEGEIAFSRILERVLSVRGYAEIFKDPIPGCQWIRDSIGSLVSGEPLPRIRELDTIPSPYVSGLLDKFFDGRLYPLVETTRGCPFTCNFCNAGDKYFTKVNAFSLDYVQDELTYIAKRASEAGTFYVEFADNNFGMLPRDVAIAELLHTLQGKHGWPKYARVSVTKNHKERIVEATRALGRTMSIGMSVQSMDPSVLEKIERKNIGTDRYGKIVEELRLQGRPTASEVILPLPGETLESHIKGLNQLLDLGVNRVTSHTLAMLHGTPYKDDDDFRSRYGFVVKYRISPLDFTRIGGSYIFDVDEVAVATNTVSFSEYVEARKYLHVLDLCFNSGVFGPLRKYLLSRRVRTSEWIGCLYGHMAHYPPAVRNVVDSFEKETIGELWDTEDELVGFYSRPEHYEKLVSYEMGGNVLFKHRVWMLSKTYWEWVETVFGCTEALVLGKVGHADEGATRDELKALREYILSMLHDCFSEQGLEGIVENVFQYDILSWLQASDESMLRDHLVSEPIRLRFFFGPEAIASRQDAFRRYGTEIAGLTKMLQRAPNISLVRDVAYKSETDGRGTSTELVVRAGDQG